MSWRSLLDEQPTLNDTDGIDAGHASASAFGSEARSIGCLTFPADDADSQLNPKAVRDPKERLQGDVRQAVLNAGVVGPRHADFVSDGGLR